ncbi:hypothetical protein RclHR1_02940003 [Rhizophagus clarus]|uniref:DUF659 domain-containing protein n=1 Tax=Rhizophagus clarus TaxID=94130 RepID=A0A2Z6RKH4_9GLOM|nr:hypothetical protein RclHR1_02940003 [Rhizophagus clarus]
MNIRCIAHSYNLISKDIIQHTFAVRMIRCANRIVQFFKKSHKAAAMLKEKSSNIKLVVVALKHILKPGGDMQHLSEILLPIKNAILTVEAAQSTLADAYINLLKIAAAIQNLSTDEYKGFRNHCIRKFNHRFEEFNDPAYQLAFFLHPVYKGAGLKFGTFPVIANYAGQLWQRMGETKKSCEQLITQLHHYKDQNFNLSNTAEQLYQIHEEIPSEMVKNIAETVFNELEKEVSPEEPVSDELPNPAEYLHTDELNLNLNISDMVNYRSPIFHPNGTHFNNNEGEEYGDEYSENEEDYEYDVDEIIISRLEEMNVN